MSRRYISQLANKEIIDQVFMACNKQLRPNRNGNLYLQMHLTDKSGLINAMLWNASESIYRGFENGDYVHVTGTAQLYQGEMQIIATGIQRVSPVEVDESDFLRVTDRQIDHLVARLTELLRSIKNPHLRNLADCFLLDDALMRKFATAPAAVKNHHAYRGGLLEHVVNIMEVVRRIADLYPQLDSELLLMGVLLHDLGKVEELSYERDFAYTDAGQLLGHVVMAVGMLDNKIREAERLSGEAIPEEIVLRLKHMIVSHHGSYDFGSPVLPMTPEAIALHYLDNFDAKVYSFARDIREDRNQASAWTPYNQGIQRRLFKGVIAAGTADSGAE
jgi:3'-5' exoribonuclease